MLKPYLSGNLGYYWSPLRLVKLAVTRKALFAPGATEALVLLEHELPRCSVSSSSA